MMRIHNENTVLAWSFALRFIRISVPLLLLLAAVLWLLYRGEWNVRQTRQVAGAESALQLARQAIEAELGGLRGDVLYLAEEVSLRSWIERGAPADRARVGTDFLAFIRHHTNYDQARFIDAQGHEVVRINAGDGARQPSVVAENQLQDKSARYYVKETLGLDAGQIYISPFDLNVEKGVIAEPLMPVIRVGTPVVDGDGRKRGLVMLSYRGQRLLDRLRQIGERNDGELWLLDTNGYWLLGPSRQQEWGFMYPQRRELRFQRDYPQVWEAIVSGPPLAQLNLDQALFTYARIDPQSVSAPKAQGWILVVHSPRRFLRQEMAGYARHLGVAYAVLALMLVFASGVIAYKDLQRRQSEARRRDSETRFGALLDAAPDAIVILDQRGRVQLVNVEAERGFGLSREELEGRDVVRLVPQRLRQRYCADFATYLSNPAVRSMGLDSEMHMLRGDGEEYPVEVRLSPLMTEQGTLIIAIIRDVSARNAAQEAQRQLQLRYQELVNNLPIGVYRNTPGERGSFIEVNAAMLEIFEADSADELLERPVSDLYCNPDERRLFSQRLMEQGYTKSQELHLKTLKGRAFHAAITAVRKRDSSGRVYFDGIVEDVSERKENERSIRQLNASLRARSVELETINRELESFSYSVSHDLRAPLRAMDGFSQSLLHDYVELLDEKGKDRLRRIRSAAQRMAILIDDLLKLSRVSRSEIVWQKVDLTSLAHEAIEDLKQADGTRKVEFSVQPDLIASGDPRLLRILVANLLGNAWKFTAKCEEAKIEMGGKAGPEGYIYHVRDNGAGFDMAYADKLFGAFQRLHDSREFPGSGIGLATVQRVISKHAGRVWAESTPGEGATFYFTLGKSEEL